MSTVCPICQFAINLPEGKDAFWCRCTAHISTSGLILRPPVEHKELSPLATRITIPNGGPGTELEPIIKAIGIEPKAKEGCGSCNALRDQMNIWGVQGCKENRERIVQELQARSKEYTWSEKSRAALLALRLDFRINPLDPFGSIVDQAIKMAEQKAETKPPV